LISILKSATELDRLEGLLSTATECYGLAIRSVSQYTPEIDVDQVANFRCHLSDLERQWQVAKTADGLRAVQASFRGELREYRDQTQVQLARLRKELESAAAAMTSFADGLANGSADCEAELKHGLRCLESVSVSDDLLEIRGAIREAVSKISVSLEQMRRVNDLVVAQLQDEIRVLHQEFQAERRTLFTDASSGAWTRQKLDLKINDLLRQNDRFCVIAVSVRNLSRIKLDWPQTTAEGTLKALLMRFRETCGDDIHIGRWTENQFVAIMDVEPTAIGPIALELARKLGGSYSTQDNGVAHSVVLEIDTKGLERAQGTDPAGFIRKLDQLTRSLSQLAS
jgi:GGDEF domain-containing protein